jgi:hypothetical protein
MPGNVITPHDVRPPKATRELLPGTRVKIAKRSHVVDRERAHENLPPEERIPIEAEVTGLEGTVMSTPYESPSKGGEICVPIEVGSGAVLGVPENRLEPVGPARGHSGSGRVATGSNPRYAAGWDRVFGRRKSTGSRRKK